MRSLRILVNNIELDHVREDAKFREENSCFFDTLRVAHTTRPIRIVDNEKAVDALGELKVTTAGKKKYFPCRVIRGAISYPGLLTQHEKLTGYRKCDLKYGSELNDIMDKKIASFFPTFSVTGAAVPVPYSNEAEDVFEVQNEWAEEAAWRNGKIFPQVHWQLPQMEYRDKYGTDLKSDDSHYHYRGYLNHRDFNGLSTNEIISNTTYFTVHNRNALSPQVFALSPLFYAFQSIGYVLRGSVVRSDFFKRLLHISFADNMSKIKVKPIPNTLNITLPAWEQKGIPGVIQGLSYQTYVKEVDFTINDPGEYKLGYDLTMNLNDNHYFGVQLYSGGTLLDRFNGNYSGRFQGEFSFTVEEGEEPKTFTLLYHSYKKVIPQEYTIGHYENLAELEFFDMHPTVDFSRYLPDWTLTDYLGYYAKQFNWRIDIDDVEKTVYLNFAIEDYLIGGEILPIRKSLKVQGLKNIEAESYLVKYENDEDSIQYIDHDSESYYDFSDQNTVTLASKFKYIPFKGYTSELSEAVKDKSGEGLAIYDPLNAPFTSKTYAGKTLSIPGTGGVFQTYFKPWLLFKLNASPAKLIGPFTQTELFQINKTRKIYIDHQLWLVKAVEYKENASALFETEIEVESVTF